MYLVVVVMDDFIVPGRAGAVITGIGAGHVRVAGEELGVVVDTPDADGARPVGFAFRGDTVTVLTLRNPVHTGWNVHQQPVEKVDPRQIGGHGLAFLVDVVRDTGHIRIEHHDHKAPGPLRRVFPGNFRIPVGPETHVVLFTEYAECEFLRNRLAFLNTSNLQFHDRVSCRWWLIVGFWPAAAHTRHRICDTTVLTVVSALCPDQQQAADTGSRHTGRHTSAPRSR